MNRSELWKIHEAIEELDNEAMVLFEQFPEGYHYDEASRGLLDRLNTNIAVLISEARG